MKKTIKIVLIALVMAILVLSYYRHLGKKTAEKVEAKQTTELSQVQSLLLRNLETDYPPSPKEVVKYYSDITLCYYNENYTDEELESLALKSTLLMDDELVAHQSWEQYLQDLKIEIANMKSQNSRIYSYNPSASTDVVYFNKDGYECASLYCTYTIRLASSMGSTREIFILRKDEKGHWKIYGWDLAPEGE